MKREFTQTENGALQLRDSGNRCLDLFAEVGSARALVRAEPQTLLDLFANAIAENTRRAMAVMYWARSVRQGAGERDVFHALFGFAYRNFPAFVLQNLALVGELGYLKDYVRIADTFPELEDAIAEIFSARILAGDHFASKWLPRRTRLHRLVQVRTKLDNASFRRLLARQSACVEQQICAGRIGEIDYAKVPSKAFNRYRAVFLSKDRDRFLETVVSKKINTAATYPHEVFAPCWDGEASRLGVTPQDMAFIVERQWRNLRNFIAPQLRFIAVLDTSASMTSGSDRIAFPLAVYCAEHLEGMFKDKIISFSADARYFDVGGCSDVASKVAKLRENSIVENTNIASVFRLLLQTAMRNKIPQEGMPNCLLILSDMQFDQGAEYDMTLIDRIKLDYKYAGYEFPAIIYWNLEAVNTGIVDDKTSNAAFVSGFNPKILESVLAGASYEEAAPTSPNAVPAARSMKIDPLAVMSNALAPIEACLDFSKLGSIPEGFSRYDYNRTRGYSFRMRRPKTRGEKPRAQFVAKSKRPLQTLGNALAKVVI